MDKSALFQHLSTQEPTVLLELLSQAYDYLEHDQRRWVFGRLADSLPSAPVEGAVLLGQIAHFEKDSLAGVYYTPFDLNSKNYMNIPEETEEWFEALSDFLKASSQLTQQGDHIQAAACFAILYRLIETMEQGEEVVFADELGSWMIQGDQKATITAYLTSLAATATPEEFAATTAPLIKRDSFQSFADQVYPTALGVASQPQREHLEAILRHQQIRTSK